MVVVIGLLGGVLVVLRKLYPSYFKLALNTNINLKIEEQLIIGPKQRLVVASFKETKYILLLGNSEILIDKIKKIS